MNACTWPVLLKIKHLLFLVRHTPVRVARAYGDKGIHAQSITSTARVPGAYGPWKSNASVAFGHAPM